MKPACIHFYLEGRDQKLFRNSIDDVDLAQQVVKTGESPGVVIRRAVTAEAVALVRLKKSWLRENEDEIKEIGCTEDEAWEAYTEGRCDELVLALEPGVIEALIDEVDGGDEEGDDDGEEEDDDEEGDEAGAE